MKFPIKIIRNKKIEENQRWRYDKDGLTKIPVDGKLPKAVKPIKIKPEKPRKTREPKPAKTFKAKINQKFGRFKSFFR